MPLAFLIAGFLLALCALSPASARSGLRVERNGGDVTISFPSWEGDTATLEYSVDLQGWIPSQTGPMEGGHRSQTRRMTLAPIGFYRLTDYGSTTYAGRVLDAATHQPVTNATVTLTFPPQTSPVATDLTDENGTFSLRVPKVPWSRTVTLEIVAPGYIPRSETRFFNTELKDFGATAYLVPVDFSPANDAWENAEPVGERVRVTGVTVGASVEATEPYSWEQDRSVWWKWIPSETRAMQVNVKGMDTEYPSVHVFTGTSLENLLSLWRTFEPGGFFVEAGRTYYIRIGTRSANGDRIQFDLREVPAAPPWVEPLSSWVSTPLWTEKSSEVPYGQSFTIVARTLGTAVLHYQWRKDGVDIAAATNRTYRVKATQVEDYGSYAVRVWNLAGQTETTPITITEAPITNDHFAQATPLLPMEDARTGENRVATLEPGERLAFTNQTGRTVWYQWTPSMNGRYEIKTSGSAFDTALAVYAGTALSDLTLVASNDNVSSNDFTSALLVEDTKNQTYFISVDGIRGEWGAFILSLRGPEVSDVPGPIPTSLAGKHLALEYNGPRELFAFLSETTGIYGQELDTFTYTYDWASGRILLTRKDTLGADVANYDISLLFKPGSSNIGTAIVDYWTPSSGLSRDTAKFAFF